jgi:hypothetical protein
MQDAVPHGGFYAIKVHHLIGSFSAVSGGQRGNLWRKVSKCNLLCQSLADGEGQCGFSLCL